MQQSKKQKLTYLYFLVIIFLGVFVFFYKLGKIPAGFYIDEALPGYNAYSILLTGKDEYGKLLPLVFRFYGSFNPPLYTYLTVIPTWIMGLNIFSARVISALAGFGAAFLVFHFLKLQGFTKEKITPYLFLPFVFISPWLLLHSRVGYEVSLGLLLFSLGVFYSWKGLSKSSNLIIGFIFLSISTYAAYTQRFIVPLFLLGFLLIFRRKIFKGKKNIKITKALVIFALIQIPNIYLLTTPAFFPKENLFSRDIVLFLAQKANVYLPYQISHALAYIREIFSQYVAYFSPRSLFYLPDPDKQRSIPELSTFYFWMVIPYFIGMYYLWKERKKNVSKLLFLLLMISPIPAAFTKDPFATHRALPLFLPMILIIGKGVDRVVKVLPPKVWVPLFLVLFMFSSLLLWRSYFVFLPQERADNWMYGVKELAEEINKRPETDFLIDQSRKKPLYINLAFFLKYPPSMFQQETGKTIKDNYYQLLDFDSHYQFGKVETRNIDWQKDPCVNKIIVGDSLAISEDQAIEHNLSEVFEIYDPLGNIVFKGYETNPL